MESGPPNAVGAAWRLYLDLRDHGLDDLAVKVHFAMIEQARDEGAARRQQKPLSTNWKAHDHLGTCGSARFWHAMHTPPV